MKLSLWVKASRLPAQTFIIPALLLGQALLFYQMEQFDLIRLIWIQIYGLLMHFFIVYANDVADFDTDKLNHTYTPFTGGSRVLIEGGLSKTSLKKAANLFAALTLLMGGLLSLINANIWIIIFVAIGMLIMHAYSFKPIKLSYRGFGETLQMIGVGLILPLVGFLSQGGALNLFPWLIAIVFLPSQLAMAMSTSMPDEPSDRLSKKQTSTVLLGVKTSQYVMISLYAISVFLLLLISKVSIPLLWLISLFALILIQFLLVTFKNPKPGNPFMMILVSLSILTNTLLVLGYAILLFQ